MKKLLSVLALSSVVLSGISMNEAHAANINWFNKTTASKVKAGKFQPNGFKVGRNFSYYKGKKNYYVSKKSGIMTKNDSQAYAYFQANKPLNTKKISVIRSQVMSNISKKTVRKYYGTPLLVVKNLAADDGYAYVEFYRNSALFYYRNLEWNSYRLTEIHVLNNPNKDVSKKWAKIYKQYRPYLNNPNPVK
ncbi:hypothetical protein ACMGE6_02170 [Macrococcus equi]|uniref:hypothetical protein n=1 Tax=Macrococcus equi TaxID=3395462 RepID=UPI0039BE0A36